MTKTIEENGIKYKSMTEGLVGKTYFSVIYHMHHQIDYSLNSYGKDLCDKIIEVSKLGNAPLACMLKKHSPATLQQIIAKTQFIDTAISSKIVNDHLIRINERIYCILNDITVIPECSKCGKVLANFDVGRRCSTHYEFCSKECAVTADTTVKLRVKTFVSRSDEAKQATRAKTEKTQLERFGNKSFMKSDYFKQKQQDFIQSNGGTNNVSQIRKIRQKVINTNIQRYGCTCNLASENGMQKKKDIHIQLIMGLITI